MGIVACKHAGTVGTQRQMGNSPDDTVPGSAYAMELPVILSAGEDGYLAAECPVIPGCISQGRTRAEALRNIREAIELCVEGQAEEGWSISPPWGSKNPH